MRHEKLSSLDPLVGEWVMHRVYRATLRDRAWTIWGQAGPEFYQRFTATFSPDGSAIDGAWERSGDRAAWEHDFAVSYAKVG